MMAPEHQLDELVRSRRSVRSYTDQRLGRALLEEMMDLVRLAPSARNRQEWRFVVVDEPGLVKRISTEGKTSEFVSKAAAVVAAVATSPDYVMRCGADASDVDLAIALDHLQLLAWARGIGSCWLGSFDERGVAGVLGVPEDNRVVGLMTLGYPAEKPEMRPRKGFREVVGFNEF